MSVLTTLLKKADALRFKVYEATPNGSAKLQAVYQAVDDGADTMEAVIRALDDGDTDEARRLAMLGLRSLNEHAEELKGLM